MGPITLSVCWLTEPGAHVLRPPLSTALPDLHPKVGDKQEFILFCWVFSRFPQTEGRAVLPSRSPSLRVCHLWGSLSLSPSSCFYAREGKKILVMLVCKGHIPSRGSLHTGHMLSQLLGKEAILKSPHVRPCHCFLPGLTDVVRDNSWACPACQRPEGTGSGTTLQDISEAGARRENVLEVLLEVPLYLLS